MKALIKNKEVILPKNIVENIKAVGSFAKQYRWRYMCRMGKKLGVKQYTIARHVPVPEGVTFAVANDPTEPAAEKENRPVAIAMDLFSEQKPVEEPKAEEAATKSSKPDRPVKLDGLVLYGDMGTLKTSLAVSFLKTAIAVNIKCHMVNRDG